MADQVAFELVSPERLVYSEPAEMVVLPGAEGDFAVLPGHAPFISALRPGAIEIYAGERIVERIFVGGGIAEVANDRLTVLAEDVRPMAEIDRAAIETQMRDAREDLADAKDEAGRARAQDRIDRLQHILDAL